jgi:hypothetical protein
MTSVVMKICSTKSVCLISYVLFLFAVLDLVLRDPVFVLNFFVSVSCFCEARWPRHHLFQFNFFCHLASASGFDFPCRCSRIFPGPLVISLVARQGRPRRILRPALISSAPIFLCRSTLQLKISTAISCLRFLSAGLLCLSCSRPRYVARSPPQISTVRALSSSSRSSFSAGQNSCSGVDFLSRVVCLDLAASEKISSRSAVICCSSCRS